MNGKLYKVRFVVPPGWRLFMSLALAGLLALLVSADALGRRVLKQLLESGRR